MSNNAELKANEWVNWIEEAITKNYFKYYEYDQFSNIQEIGCGGFGKVYRANRKSSNKYFALKSFFNFNNFTAKEIVREIKLQREVDFHDNIISFYGITSTLSSKNQRKKYLLVMEYADGGTLRNYLKEHFENLSWNDKFNLAFQLAYAISCLHDEGIVHRDLHSNNVLIHQNDIKLADFGLSKRIDETSNSQSRIFGMVAYVDPKIFNRTRNSNNQLQIYSLNEKSDVYSTGILLWEISSGRPPFCNEPNDAGLTLEILQGLRETPIPNTPKDYIKIYTDCWHSEPNNRPNINQVVDGLRVFNTKENIIIKDNCDANIQLSSNQHLISNIVKNPENVINNSIHGDLSQIIQNFREMNTKEIEFSISSSDQIINKITSSAIAFSVIVDELAAIPHIAGNIEESKHNILNYLNDINVSLPEIYNWLVNNQNNSNAIVLLGDFNDKGIGISVDKQKAFELYQKAADLENTIGINNLGKFYRYGIGTNIDKQKAFELHQKAANLGNADGINDLGICYRKGIGTNIDKQKAFKLHQKAADLGNANGINNLGTCYRFGIGISIDEQKAFELFQKAANLGGADGINYLGICYRNGIETSIDIQKAFELHQKAANLGSADGINNLGICYRKGVGTIINKQKAFELHQKAANLGNADGINNLGICYRYGIGISIDKQKALELFQKAANLENNLAQINLAGMYKNGAGIKKNMNKAIYWYKKSAEQGNQYAQYELEQLL